MTIFHKNSLRLQTVGWPKLVKRQSVLILLGRKNMIRKLFVTLILTMIFSINIVAAPWITMKITYNYNTYDYSAEAVYVNVNGKKLDNLPMEPIILNGTTLVPAREVCEAFGAIVDWKKETEEIYIAYEDSIVVLKINSTNANLNGINNTLSVPARIINNKTMIPVRFVSEAFNKKVDWSNDERTIFIKDEANAGESQAQQTTENVNESLQNANSFGQNIMFDSVNKTLILKNSNTAFDAQANNITYSNDEKTVTVSFNSNLGTSINAGSYPINNNGITDVIYTEDNGKSVFKFNADKKLNIKIESDKTYVYIILQG